MGLAIVMFVPETPGDKGSDNTEVECNYLLNVRVTGQRQERVRTTNYFSQGKQMQIETKAKSIIQK